MRTKITRKLVALLAAVSVVGSTAMAATIYDNTTTYLGEFYTPGAGVDFGDEITFAGTDRIVTDFGFDIFASGAAGTGTFFIRSMDGPAVAGGNAPGSVLYQAPFSYAAGENAIAISGLSVVLPDTVTWSVSIDGAGAGLVAFGPPTTGSSFADFWQKDGGVSGNEWRLMTLDGQAHSSFAARVTAVPEPSTYLYALLGGLTWLGYAGFRRRQ